MDLKMDWKFSNMPMLDISHVFTNSASKIIQDQTPEIADLFPWRNRCEAQVHFDDGWFSARISYGFMPGTPASGAMKGEELNELLSKIKPYEIRDHKTLVELLGTGWFSFDRFTYVGPFYDNAASWSHALSHLLDWINNFVFPEVINRNQLRVQRAIPAPPNFDIGKILPALWILESESSMNQGSAFHLSEIGLVTCAHVLKSDTTAFKADNFNQKYPVKIKIENKDIDLAIVEIDSSLGIGLTKGSADYLTQMDHLAVTGFPNYRYGDSGIIVPGLVIGFRMISGIRRILTNAPIIGGNSGGPVIDKDNRVIGVAVTGADRIEKAQETENHGIIPIDALNFFNF